MQVLNRMAYIYADRSYPQRWSETNMATSKNSRLPKHGYEPDIPLPATINVVCLVIVGWEKKYTGEIDPDKGYAGLMLAPNVCDASTYERVGVWSHECYTGLDDIKVTPVDMQSFRLV